MVIDAEYRTEAENAERKRKEYLVSTVYLSLLNCAVEYLLFYDALEASNKFVLFDLA